MIQKLKAFAAQLPVVAKMLIPLAVLFILGVLTPRDTRFRYEFRLGQVWRHGDLLAPFDFPIYKTDEDIAAEERRILDNTPPYFVLDSKVSARVKAHFEQAFDQQLRNEADNADFREVGNHAARYRQVGRGLLDHLYQIGIVERDSILAGKPSSYVIQVIHDNETHKTTLGSLYDLESAVEFLTDTLPHTPLRNPDFLLPVLEQVIRPNIRYSDTLTHRFLERAKKAISPVAGFVKAGDLILSNNARITPADYQKLVSLKRQYESGLQQGRSKWWLMAGNFAFTGGLLFLLFAFVRRYHPDVYARVSDVLLLYLWPLFYGLLAIFVVRHPVMNQLFIPFAILPLVTKNFFRPSLTIVLYLVVVLLATFILGQGFDYAALQIVAGLGALLIGRHTLHWGQFFKSIGVILAIYLVFDILLSFVKTGAVNHEMPGRILWFLLNGFLLLLSYPLVQLLGRTFGKLTRVRLVELSDYNHPLLQRLSQEAPGTFQHSLQVSNLAEAAANAIGANALLVKTGALYHDIGKLKNPQYFIENQKGKNPHDALSADESAKIIIGHVKEGERLARKQGLPRSIIDFILTHHGTGRVEYFYRTMLKQHGEDAVNIEDFTYPGPRPRTKEQVILMLADSLEAASHSITDINREKLDALIQKIVENKKTSGQFDDSDISFADFYKVIDVIRDRLLSIYHIRVEYPD